MALSGNRLKPIPWSFSPLLVARQYQDLWRGCQLFVPFWSPKTTGTTEFLANSIIQDIGPHKIHMTAAGTFTSGSTIAQVIAAQAGLAYHQTTFNGNESFNSDTRLTNVMASSDATVAVLGEWGSGTFFGTNSISGTDGDILLTGIGNVFKAQNKFSASSISGTTNLADGLPHLCLYEYDNSSQARTLFVDGKQEASGGLGAANSWNSPSIMGDSTAGGGSTTDTKAYYFAIWNRKLSSIEKALLTADPFGMIRPAFQPINFGTVAAGVNVSIAGASATSASGTVSLAITSNVSVSGAAATSGAGTPSETVSVVSPGASATSAAGTPSHEIDVVSPGAGANTAVGTVTASLGVPVIGAPTTASSGTMIGSEGAQPLGAPATSSSGTVIPSISFVLPGASASASAGTATASDSPQPLGASAISASGTVSLGITSNISLMGSSAIASAGLLQALGISSSILVPGVVPGQPASGATLVAGVVPGQPASGGTVAPGVVPGQPASGATLVAGVSG